MCKYFILNYLDMKHPRFAQALISLSLCMRAATAYSLCSDYSAADLHVIREYGIDLRKLATYITRTRAMYGKVASITLCLAAIITLVRDDSDAEYIISCAAFGVDVDFTPHFDLQSVNILYSV